MIPFKRTNPIKLWLLVLSAALLACSALMPSVNPGVATAEPPMPGGETPTSAPLPAATEPPPADRVAKALAWSPDQTYLVVATDQGLNFHAPAARNLAFTRLPDTSLNTLAFSHNGKMLAVGGEQAFLLDASTWEARKIPLDTEFYGEVITLAFSPDDQFLAISTGPRILLFETPTGKQVQEFKKLDGPSARYDKLLFSPDGKTLVSASGSSELKSVRLWEVATAELRHDFGENSFDSGEILVFSEDGKFLNTSGRTWDFNTYEDIRPAKYFFTTIGLSPQGNYSLDWEGEGISFSPLNPQSPHIPGFRVSTYQIFFSPDESLLAYIHDGAVYLKKINSGLAPRKIFTGMDGLNYAFAPNGSALAMVQTSGNVLIYQLKTGQTQTLPVKNLSYLLGFSPDGQTLALSTTDNGLELWDVASATLKIRHEKWQGGLYFSRDSRRYFTYSSNPDATKNLHLYDIQSGKELQSYPLCYGAIHSGSQDQQIIAMPSSVKECLSRITVFQAESHQVIQSFEFPFPEFINSYALSPEGKYLAVVSMLPITPGSDSGQWRLSYWEVSSGRKIKETLINHTGVAESAVLFFSQDGKRLAFLEQRQADPAFYNLPDLTATPEAELVCGQEYFLSTHGFGNYSLCNRTLLRMVYGTSDWQQSYQEMLASFNLDKKIRVDGIRNMVLVTDLVTNKEIVRFAVADEASIPKGASTPILSPDGNLLAIGLDTTQEVALWNMDFTTSEPQAFPLPGYKNTP